MKRSALCLKIAIIVGLCVPATPSMAAQCSTSTRDTASDFADAVYVLPANYGPSFTSTYDPNTFTPPPNTAPTQTLGSIVRAASPPAQYVSMWYDLCNAFELAKPRFQRKLSALSGVYIDTTACADGSSSCFSGNSWGVRSAGGEYISAYRPRFGMLAQRPQPPRPYRFTRQTSFRR